MYSTKTKINLYRSNVKSVLLYGAESWKMNKKENSMLDTFQNRCLRRILGIRWPDRISNDKLYRTTGVAPVSKEVKRRRWKWIGRVLRMEPSEDPRKALKWLPVGRRKVERLRTTWRRMAQKEKGCRIGVEDLGRGSRSCDQLD